MRADRCKSLVSSRRARTRIAGGIGTLVLAALAGGFVSTASANANGTGRVLIDPCLNLRAGASGSTALIGCIPKDTIITIDCTATGNAVTGPYGTTTLWDHTSYDGKSGFVSDAWIYTGQAAAVAGPCSTASPPPPAAAPKKAKVRCSNSLTYKANVHRLCEKRRYVRETVAMSYTAFERRRTDFGIRGCNPSELPAPQGCRKPAPYNDFDWSASYPEPACSGPTGLIPPAGAWTAIFKVPCQLHDFGYRNLGPKSRYRLQKTETGRIRVDKAFKREMYRVCSTWANGLDKVACYNTARTMFNFVNSYNFWIEAWGPRF